MTENLPQYIGSSGTFAAALLETTGYYYQDLILNTLSSTFAGSVGYLIYMIGVIIAIVNILLNGSYKFSGWLLVGPAMFFFVITNRVETRGSEWLFAGQSQPEIALEGSVGDIFSYRGEDSEVLPPARVSTVFAWFNGIISGAVDEIVRLMNVHRTDANWSFIVRQEVYSELQRVELDSPQFRDLLHAGFLGQCREYVDRARQLVDEADQHLHNRLRQEYERLGNQRVEINSQYAKQWLAGFRAAYDGEYGVYTGIIEKQYSVVDTFIQRLGQNSVEVAAGFSGALPAAAAVVERDVRNGINCDQVWQFTRVGLILKAKEALESRLSTEDEARYTTILNSLGQITGAYDEEAATPTSFSPDNAVRIYQTIGVYLLRNEVAKGSLSAFTNEYVTRSALSNIRLFEGNNLVTSYNLHSAHYQPEYRNKLMTTAAQLPYYQGMVMCFLGVLFPFFALLLLLPGYHSGFLYWVGLWLWIKSWDIGFAVVMVLDEILFSMFSIAYNSGGSAPEGQLSGELSSTILALAQSDPSFTLTTYYAIVGTALMSIPVTSSMLVLGSVKAGAGLVAKGIDNYSQSAGEGSKYIRSMSTVQGQSISGQRGQQEAATSAAQNALQGKPFYDLQGPSSGERDLELSGSPYNTHFQRGLAEGTFMGFDNPTEAVQSTLGQNQLISAQGLVGALAEGQGVQASSPLSRGARMIDRALGAWSGNLTTLRNKRLQVAANTGAFLYSHSSENQEKIAIGGNSGMTQVSWGMDPVAETQYVMYEAAANAAMWNLIGHAGPMLSSLAGLDKQDGKIASPQRTFEAITLMATYAMTAELARDDSVIRGMAARLGRGLGDNVTVQQIQEELSGFVDAAEAQFGDEFIDAAADLREEFGDLGETGETMAEALAAVSLLGEFVDDNSLLGPPDRD